MKTFFNIFGGTMIVLGLIAIAGSANDCDGKCMEVANTFGQMMFIVFWGAVSIIIGSFICIKIANN